MYAGAKEVVQSLAAVARNHHLVANVVFFQRTKGEQFIVGIVLHQQNNLVVHCAPGSEIWLSQSEINCCSSIHETLGPHGPAVAVNNSLHGGQANAGAGKFSGGVETLKGAEQAGSVGRIETGAIVAHKIGATSVGGSFTKLDFRPLAL